MKHGSLFSGIGGAELAAEWAGWENVFHCEINPFGRKVLDYYWPKATSYEDITKADFSIWRGRIDILTGGFPCQPFSLAGKRKGTEDDRNLWPRMFEVIQQIQPTWIVGENVYGLVNWDGGVVFDKVQADLESEGYEVQSVILPACAINAPHRRDIVWIVSRLISNPSDNGLDKHNQSKEGYDSERCRVSFDEPSSLYGKGIITNSNSIGLQWGQVRHLRLQGKESDDKQPKGCSFTHPQGWEKFPTKSPVCSGNDGISERLDSITFPKWRNESIKAYGNAWVPQVAYEIFKVINLFNK